MTGTKDEARATWDKARLIPVSGIGNAAEAERRAASALLAVLGAVAEFGRAVTKDLGAPAGRIAVYTETPFKLDGRVVRPDGLIEVTRGKHTWTAVVEVKTGSDELQAKQLADYLDVAKANGFDTVLTISNEIPPMPGQHPTPVDMLRGWKPAASGRPSIHPATARVPQRHRGRGCGWVVGSRRPPRRQCQH